MRKVLNYLSLLRIYSLVDLALLLVASKTSWQEAVGVILLHMGFLAMLEARHSHSGRCEVPRWLWIPLTLAGAGLYQHLEVVPFLVCSYMYTRKNHGYWGLSAPVFRGCQYFFLLAGITNDYFLPLVSFVVMVGRNTVGDWRDVEKDQRQGMETLPMVFGAKGTKYCHLVAMLVSSTIWWSLSPLPVSALFAVFLVEIVTYDLTPR